MRTQKTLTLLACFALVASVSGEALAQGGTYGGAIIAPGTPPVTLSGQSGGPRQASSIRAGCRGNIAMAPDHIFNITAPMSVRFEVINASGDTTMVVLGPSGVLCDDDSGTGLNPRIMQQFQPGIYQVFVGTYGGTGLLPYTIQVQGQGVPVVPVAPPIAHGGGTFGGAVLSPSSMTASLSGMSGGPVQASTRGAHCRGNIAAAPDHIVTVVSPMVLTFDVTAGRDTTLVIIGPAGVLCDDDSGQGTNPRITRPLPPGTYQIYIGTYSGGGQYPYSLSIHP